MRDERRETRVVLRQAQQPECGGMRCKGSSRSSEGRIKGTTNNTNMAHGVRGVVVVVVVARRDTTDTTDARDTTKD